MEDYPRIDNEKLIWIKFNNKILFWNEIIISDIYNTIPEGESGWALRD